MATTHLAAAALLAAIPGFALAAGPEPVPFQTYAAFFSAATRQPTPTDPQVFVADPVIPAEAGLEGIRHAAGYRPARTEQDPRATPLANAEGKPLGFTLGQWLGATGAALLTPNADGREAVALAFEGLRSDAQYSLFEAHLDQDPVSYTALDGVGGKASTFRTDGKGAAHAAKLIPMPLGHGSGIVAIYDNDGESHGLDRGDIGVDAEQQLIARPRNP